MIYWNFKKFDDWWDHHVYDDDDDDYGPAMEIPDSLETVAGPARAVCDPPKLLLAL